jgi:hypothetical protein
MTAAERQQRELARIFNLGQQLAANWPPLTDEQVEQVAFIINPRLAAPRDHAPAVLPQAA